MIIPAQAGTPDGRSRAIWGQPSVWMGDHLEIPGHGVTAKNTADGRPQKPYELKDFGPSISDGREQKSSENTVFAPGCKAGVCRQTAGCLLGALIQGFGFFKM